MSMPVSDFILDPKLSTLQPTVRSHSFAQHLWSFKILSVQSVFSLYWLQTVSTFLFFECLVLSHSMASEATKIEIIWVSNMTDISFNQPKNRYYLRNHLDTLKQTASFKLCFVTGEITRLMARHQDVAWPLFLSAGYGGILFGISQPRVWGL